MSFPEHGIKISIRKVQAWKEKLWQISGLLEEGNGVRGPRGQSVKRTASFSRWGCSTQRCCDHHGGGRVTPLRGAVAPEVRFPGGWMDAPAPGRRSDASKRGQAWSIMMAAGVAHASSAKHPTGIPAMGDGCEHFLQNLEIPRGGLWPSTNPDHLQSAKALTLVLQGHRPSVRMPGSLSGSWGCKEFTWVQDMSPQTAASCGGTPQHPASRLTTGLEHGTMLWDSITIHVPPSHVWPRTQLPHCWRPGAGTGTSDLALLILHLMSPRSGVVSQLVCWSTDPQCLAAVRNTDFQVEELRCSLKCISLSQSLVKLSSPSLCHSFWKC